MKKVLVATEKPFAKVAVDGIKEIFDHAGYETILLEKYTDPADFRKAAADVDAIIIRSDKADKELIDAAKNVKIIVRAGAGYDNIDIPATKEREIVAMNTPGQNSNAVAELAFEMMLYAARKGFAGNSGSELRGKTIGIHAYGNVGRYVARIAKGFGMELYAFDPFVNPEFIQADGITPVATADELYSKCQYVSLHIPANAETKNSIGHAILSKMPKGATLVNTARKEVIDEEGLKQLMNERTDFVYLSDVAPDNASEMREMFGDRVLFTGKKMGAQTAEANINAGLAAARQIVNYFESGDVTCQVNR